MAVASASFESFFDAVAEPSNRTPRRQVEGTSTTCAPASRSFWAKVKVLLADFEPRDDRTPAG
jgi:hypothetical protein